MYAPIEQVSSSYHKKFDWINIRPNFVEKNEKTLMKIVFHMTRHVTSFQAV